MSDHGLRKTFREHLKLEGYDFLAVETRYTAAGVPDLNFCKAGVEGWIEMKRATRGRVTIRPAQIGWVERRIDHGGRVFVAVREDDELRLYHGAQLRQLATQNSEEVAHIFRCVGGPTNWNWSTIDYLLLRWQPMR